MTDGDGDEAAPGDEAPERYDQTFFLALAAKGNDAWNAWRREATKDVHVTFAGIDFSEGDGIDFSGFQFGDEANFSGCKWRGVESEEVQNEVFVPGRACFTSAAFGHAPSFTGADFGDAATFVGATFGDEAKFIGAAFGDSASFAGAAFGNNASFGIAFFGVEASFTGAAFGDATDFTRALFRGRAEFSGLSYEKWYIAFLTRAALGHPHRGSKPLYGSGPDRFLTISFLHARFNGEAIFSGRSFERAANFTNARFYSPPDFDAVANASRIDFTGAHIGFSPPGKLLHCTEDSHIPYSLAHFSKTRGRHKKPRSRT